MSFKNILPFSIEISWPLQFLTLFCDELEKTTFDSVTS